MKKKLIFHELGIILIISKFASKSISEKYFKTNFKKNYNKKVKPNFHLQPNQHFTTKTIIKNHIKPHPNPNPISVTLN